MVALLAPVLAAACLAHPPDLDREVGRRALPWLPPDLARQVVKHEREFLQGAEAAASWPATYHRWGGEKDVNRAVISQCQRLVTAIRSRAPFSEVVAGLGALAHFTLDAGSPFAARSAGDAHAQAFSRYAASAAPRIPLVFYGQARAAIAGPATGFRPLLANRRGQASRLESLVREDLDRAGGPAAWRRLDDRSTTFGVASVTLNHAATDFANLASWVWRNAGGLVPELPAENHEILVWRGDARPREEPRAGGMQHEPTGTRLGFRQGRP